MGWISKHDELRELLDDRLQSPPRHRTRYSLTPLRQQLPKLRSASKGTHPCRRLFIVDVTGRQFTCEDVQWLKSVFDSLGRVRVPLDALVAAFSAGKRRPGVVERLQAYSSLNPSLSFKELLPVIYPGLVSQQYNSMLNWVNFTGKFFRENPRHQLPQKLRKLSLTTARNLRSMFHRLDKNKNGCVEFEELNQGFRDKFNESCLKKVFNEYDVDHNEQLDFEEFVKLCTPEDVDIDPKILELAKHA